MIYHIYFYIVIGSLQFNHCPVFRESETYSATSSFKLRSLNRCNESLTKVTISVRGYWFNIWLTKPYIAIVSNNVHFTACLNMQCNKVIWAYRPLFPSRYRFRVLGSWYWPIPSTDPIPEYVSGYTALCTTSPVWIDTIILWCASPYIESGK